MPRVEPRRVRGQLVTEEDVLLFEGSKGIPDGVPVTATEQWVDPGMGRRPFPHTGYTGLSPEDCERLHAEAEGKKGWMPYRDRLADSEYKAERRAEQAAHGSPYRAATQTERHADMLRSTEGDPVLRAKMLRFLAAEAEEESEPEKPRRGRRPKAKPEESGE